MKTGNTGMWRRMPALMLGPQWSPVMKTGNTPTARAKTIQHRDASMEPGHEDREYLEVPPASTTGRKASMEPGHEDREYRFRTDG